MHEEASDSGFFIGFLTGRYILQYGSTKNFLKKEKSYERSIGKPGENVIFVLEFLAVVAVLFVIAYAAEKYAQKKAGVNEKIFHTRKIVMIGMFSAIASILMLFEIQMPFAPFFYKLDFSELPALIGTFAFGPVAGVMIEFCKILLKLLFKSTSTAFVGELANFAVGCSFILPASVIYLFKKNKKTAIVGCGIGTVILTIFGTAFNAVYLLPKFAELLECRWKVSLPWERRSIRALRTLRPL